MVKAETTGRKKSKSYHYQQLQESYKDPNYVCTCGLKYEEHKIFFAGMITDKPMSVENNSGSIFNHLAVCSHPDIQLKCHNRSQGYPTVENTLSYGAPSWRWQILAGPFVDYRASEFIRMCGAQKRTPMRRFVQFIKLAIDYNKTKLGKDEQPLTIYLVGDITKETLPLHLNK